MSTTPQAPYVPPPRPPREKPIKGWKAIADAVCSAIGEEVHIQTIRRWAARRSTHRLPVERFAGTPSVYLLPSLLELWAATRTRPLDARPPGNLKPRSILPFKREKTITSAQPDAPTLTDAHSASQSPPNHDHPGAALEHA